MKKVIAWTMVVDPNEGMSISDLTTLIDLAKAAGVVDVAIIDGRWMTTEDRTESSKDVYGIVDVRYQNQTTHIVTTLSGPCANEELRSENGLYDYTGWNEVFEDGEFLVYMQDDNIVSKQEEYILNNPVQDVLIDPNANTKVPYMFSTLIPSGQAPAFDKLVDLMRRAKERRDHRQSLIEDNYRSLMIQMGMGEEHIDVLCEILPGFNEEHLHLLQRAIREYNTLLAVRKINKITSAGSRSPACIKPPRKINLERNLLYRTNVNVNSREGFI